MTWVRRAWRGSLARQKAVRNPSRTASTAAASPPTEPGGVMNVRTTHHKLLIARAALLAVVTGATAPAARTRVGCPTSPPRSPACVRSGW